MNFVVEKRHEVEMREMLKSAEISIATSRMKKGIKQ